MELADTLQTDGTPADDTALSPTPRTTLRRYAHRGRTDRAELYDVLDEGIFCFLGTVVDGCPRVTPMVYGRIGDALYVHGSVANQGLVAAAKDGKEVCVTVATIQGLVLANSLFHHSVNFRSAMIYGSPRLVTDEEEQLAALLAAADQLVPGRSEALRPPTPKERAATMILAIPLAEASVKVREGPPNGEPADYDLDIWAGVVPLRQTWTEPEPDPKLREGTRVPGHVSRLIGLPAGQRSRARRGET